MGGWSGDPASPSRPISPGDSMAVLITPPRAGTFMYHTHGEPGHELSQGLYGGFLVLPRGAPRDPARDRLFMLASRGAVINSPPAINGRAQAPTEQFTVGQPVRLRFAHISADEIKTVRLLRDGQVIPWRRLAKDGADLPEHQRVDAPAQFVLGVGETHDVEWTPTAPGLYLLEVRTTYYPQRGGAQIQRLPFAVGSVSDAAIYAAIRGTDLPVVALDSAALAPYDALYADPVGAGTTVRRALRLQLDQGRLYSDKRNASDTVPGVRYMIPLGDDVFAFGVFSAGVITQASRNHRARFLRTNGAITGVEITDSGAVAVRLVRVADPVLSEKERDRVIGSWKSPDNGLTVAIDREGDALTLVLPGAARRRLRMESSTRFFLPSIGPGFALRVVLDGDQAVAVELVPPGRPAIRLQRMNRPGFPEAR